MGDLPGHWGPEASFYRSQAQLRKLVTDVSLGRKMLQELIRRKIGGLVASALVDAAHWERVAVSKRAALINRASSSWALSSRSCSIEATGPTPEAGNPTRMAVPGYVSSTIMDRCAAGPLERNQGGRA